MRSTRVLTAVLAAAFCIATCFCLGGCGTTGTKEVTQTPTVKDSALVNAGKLTVGIDSSNAPFGGESNGSIVGLDVDVAAALADDLGLELQVVDISGQTITNVVSGGKVDIVMSAASKNLSTTTTLIGPYVNNGPALFGKDVSGTVDISKISGSQVGVYKGSIAATTVSQYCGTENLVSFTSLSEAFDALKSGSVKYVASDAVAGGYIALSYTGVDYAASLKSESLCYIGIPAKNTTLSEALSSSLTEISGNGVLQTVISKWAGTSTAEEITPTSVNTLTATTTASESTSTTTTGA